MPHGDWSNFDSAMLRPLRYQVNGSLQVRKVHIHSHNSMITVDFLYTCGIQQTCGVALKLGWAINVGGGFCYNTAGYSKGLALYDDLLHCLMVRTHTNYTLSYVCVSDPAKLNHVSANFANIFSCDCSILFL